MKYRRLFAAIAALTVMMTAFSCGKSEKNETAVNETTVTEEKTTEKTDKTASATETVESDTESSSNNEQGSVENESDEEIKAYTAEVTLGSKTTVNGSNVTVDGSVITVTGGGDYIFTGTLTNGQICVKTENAEDKVTLVLNGVNITSSSGPAILVEEAKKCTVKPRDGSVNYLSDSGAEETNEAVIFSNDTLRLKGNGELNITANNAHGVAGDDDVIVESGTYNITSMKSGIYAHDDITINGGTLKINGGTNGIKSKGTININGGRTIISGGTNGDKSSVYASSTFNYTGGYVFAAGSKVSVPTYSETPYVVADLGEAMSAGSEVKLYVDGNEMIAFEPNNQFRCIMMLAPELTSGSTFHMLVNSMFSEKFTVSDGCNQFVIKFVGVE